MPPARGGRHDPYMIYLYFSLRPEILLRNGTGTGQGRGPAALATLQKELSSASVSH